jgi:hypothetical protein
VSQPKVVAAYLWGSAIAQQSEHWAWRALRLPATCRAPGAPPDSKEAASSYAYGQQPSSASAAAATAVVTAAAAVGWVPVPMTPLADSFNELLTLEEEAGEPCTPAGWPTSVRYQPSLEWSVGARADELRTRLSRPLPCPLVQIRPVPPSHPAAVALREAHAEERRPAGQPAPEPPALAYGLYASSALPAETWVCDYGGTVKRQKKCARITRERAAARALARAPRLHACALSPAPSDRCAAAGATALAT